MGENGNTGGSHREDWSAVVLQPKSSSSRGLWCARVDEKPRGEGGAGVRTAEGKKWGKKRGGVAACGGVTILYQRVDVGDG
jgi:hypothetical protein